jgi:hypothetical protein
MSEIVHTITDPSQILSMEGRKLIELLRQTSVHDTEFIQSTGVERRRGGRAARFKSTDEPSPKIR